MILPVVCFEYVIPEWVLVIKDVTVPFISIKAE